MTKLAKMTGDTRRLKKLTDLVSCSYCNGRGKRNMGGMESKCIRCDGVGKVASIVVNVESVNESNIARKVEVIDSTVSHEPIPNQDMFEGKQDTCTLNDIFPGIEAVTEKPPKKSPALNLAVPEISPQLQAALDETKMTKADWNTKYGTMMAGTDPKMRNEMRTEYAKSKKIAPRKVNSMAAQDGVVENE